MKFFVYKILAMTMLFMMATGICLGADIVSAGKKGYWSAESTWVGNVVPTAGDNVVIVDRDTITFDMDTTMIANLTVGAGDSCLLRISKTKPTILAVTGNILVNPLAAITVQTRDTSWHTDLIHKLYVYGDITSNGVFDMRQGSTSSSPQTIAVMNVFFVGSTNSTVTIPGTFTKETKEFNAVTIDKTGGANVLLGSDMYISGGSSQAPNCDSYLIFKRGKVITGNFALNHLGSASAQVYGMSDTSYIVGAMGRGISNSSGVTKTYPIGDEYGYRPFRVGTAIGGLNTGHHVIVRVIHGNANTGSSVLNGGISKLSEVRYYKVTYRTVIGATNQPRDTTVLNLISPNYGLDDGIRGGNTNLRVAYSTDERATWIKAGQSTTHTTSFNTLPRQLNSDTVRPYIFLDTLATAAYVALADSGSVNPLDGTISGFSASTHTLSFGYVYLSESKIDSFVITNTGTGSLTIRSHTEVDSTEFVTSPPTPFVVPVATSTTVYVTFTPNTSGLRSSDIYFYHDAPHNPDTIKVNGVGLQMLSATVSMNASWNLISIPVIVNNYDKDSVFPTAISSAFKFQSGYIESPTLINGAGYWLKFDTAQTLLFGGKALLTDSVQVNAGWNIIGSLSAPIAVSSIFPEGTTISSLFFGYNNGYFASDTLQPGKGYWVKVTQAGKLILSSVSSASKSLRNDMQFDDMNALYFKDASGNQQTLYFSRSEQATRSAMSAMPPLPPAGIFDARFASQRMIETCSPNASGHFPIELTSVVYPVTVSWECKEATEGITLKVGNNMRFLTNPGGSFTVNSEANLSLEFSEKGQTPTEYSLSQNYPNPFNPMTNISFALPYQSVVTMKVFTLLGKEVATIINGETIASGTHTVTFHADELSTGVYFYKINAQRVADANGGSKNAVFSAVNKLLLVK